MSTPGPGCVFGIDKVADSSSTTGSEDSELDWGRVRLWGQIDTSRPRDGYLEPEDTVLDPWALSPGETFRLAYLTRGWAAHEAVLFPGPLGHRCGSGCLHSPSPLRCCLHEDACALPFQSYPKAAASSPPFGCYPPKGQDHELRREGDRI